jgi:hypothetical protein
MMVMAMKTQGKRGFQIVFHQGEVTVSVVSGNFHVRMIS